MTRTGIKWRKAQDSEGALAFFRRQAMLPLTVQLARPSAKNENTTHRSRNRSFAHGARLHGAGVGVFPVSSFELHDQPAGMDLLRWRHSSRRNSVGRCRTPLGERCTPAIPRETRPTPGAYKFGSGRTQIRRLAKRPTSGLRYLAKSCMASSASTPPVMVIGTKVCLAAM